MGEGKRCIIECDYGRRRNAMAALVSWGELSIAGLLGGLTGSFATHLFASWRDKKKEFRDAGRQFREAFVEVKRLLSIRHTHHCNLYPGAPEEYQNVIQLLPRYYQQQYAALLKFEPHLSKSDQENLRKIWNEYCCLEPDHKYPTFLSTILEGITI
jgi:hypothetical protein